METKELQALFEQELKKLNWNISPKNLYAPIEYVLDLGGKRIRPVTTLMACELFSGDALRAIKPALALEVFHNFTLLHDDIMDHAEMRRNQPTVHVKWNDNTAILSGDAMLIKAYQLLEQSNPEILPKLFKIFSQTAAEVCDGQQYDMDFESRNDVTISEYIEMIRLKTAVLLAAAMKIGAICGGADDKDAQYLYEFGIGIGIAFQLKDDLLDVYGDPKDFGKEIGGDICCNKKTFLLINAINQAEGNDKKELLQWLKKKSFDRNEKVAAVTNIYNKLHLRTFTENKMKEYYDQALTALRKINKNETEKAGFYQLAEKLMYRIS
ncbi:MAG: polyprenyl synthetase family protein [Paludibacteraceae bacterium]|nr:polyprenyl synthetase family protein [Paludibacteraceae bacterium]